MSHVVTLSLVAVLQGAAWGGVRGTVREMESRTGVGGVLVEVVGGRVSVETDSAGRYEIPGLDAGWHRIRYTRLGYREVEVQAWVAAGGWSAVDLTLAIHPLPLRALDVFGDRSAPEAGRDAFAAGDAAHTGARTLAVADVDGTPLLDRLELPRLLATLPDVALRPGGGGGLHLRGGSADQNLLLLDGAPILGGGHAMGMAGPVNPDAVEVMDVFAGVSPAQYGGRLSGVVSVETRRPDPHVWRLRGGADGFVSSLTADGPVAPGGVGVLLSGRRSTPGIVAGILERGSWLPRFWDAFGSVHLPLSEGELRLSSYRTADRLTFPVEESGGSGDNRFEWSSGTDAIRWRRPLGRVRFDAVAWKARSAGRARWFADGSERRLENEFDHLGVRWTLGVPHGSGWIQAGVGFDGYEILFDLDDGDSRERSTSELAVFGEAHHVFRDRLGVTLGLRGAVAPGADPTVEPRISLAWAPTPVSLVGLGFNRSRQLAQALSNRESVLDVAVAGDFLGHLAVDEEGPAMADQWTASFRTRFEWGGAFTLEAYTRRMTGLVLVAPLTGGPVAEGGFVRGRGSSHGVQATFDVARGPWNLSTRSHLGDVTRHAPGAAGEGRVEYRPQFHRTAWGMAGAGLRATRHLTVRAALRVGTGTPTTPVVPGFLWEASDPVLGEGDLVGLPLHAVDELNREDLPTFLRLDVGARGRWDFELGARPAGLTAFLTVENVLDRENLLALRWRPDGSPAPVRLTGLAVNAGLRFHY